MNITPHNWLNCVVSGLMSEKELLECSDDQIKYNYPIHPGFNPGNFQLFQLADLIGMTRSSSKDNHNNDNNNDDNKKANSDILFTIYVRSEKNRKETLDHSNFDTSKLQVELSSSLGYKGKIPIMFQVASNFNCQENGSIYTSVQSGHYLRNLMTDSTQGPSASAGAGLGAIIRLRHHISNPINLLSNLPEFTVINGKLADYDDNINTESLDINKVMIGLHTDLSANFDRSVRNRAVFYENGVPIDQVFVSTLALTPQKNKKISKTELQIIRFLLKAAYDGTYLAAKYRQSQYLILTLIGGGAFGNPISEIAKAMASAYIRIGKETCLKEVILPLFDPQIDHEQFVNALKKENVPDSCIRVIYKD